MAEQEQQQPAGGGGVVRCDSTVSFGDVQNTIGKAGLGVPINDRFHTESA